MFFVLIWSNNYVYAQWTIKYQGTQVQMLTSIHGNLHGSSSSRFGDTRNTSKSEIKLSEGNNFWVDSVFWMCPRAYFPFAFRIKNICCANGNFILWWWLLHLKNNPHTSKFTHYQEVYRMTSIYFLWACAVEFTTKTWNWLLVDFF